MGSNIEFNDTLKMDGSQFPGDIREGQEYFFKREGRRLYHLYPVRVFLVREEAGKWFYIGHAQVIEQTINALENYTSGKFLVTKLYSKEYAVVVNQNEHDLLVPFYLLLVLLASISKPRTSWPIFAVLNIICFSKS